jgi:Sulfotransferase family
MQERNWAKSMSRPLILLTGLPRSGTTWIAKMFDSHPSTAYFHEADRGTILRSMPLVPDVSEAETLKPMAEAFVDGLLATTNVHVVGSWPQFPKAYRSTSAAKFLELNTAASKLALALRLNLPVLPMVNYEKISNLHVVWKSVISLGRVGVFARALGGCRAIILLRHPCGHVASMLRGETEHRFAYPPSEDYTLFEILLATRSARNHGLTMKHLVSISPAERLAWRWVIMYEKSLEDTREVEGCRSVRYEDVCVEPESHARQMMEFCGLPWSTATSRFIRSSTATENKKYYSIFRDPLKSAMRWQQDLSEEEIEGVYRVVGESDLERLYPREEKLGQFSNLDPEVANRS